jgi:hypothetical protein
VLGHITQVVHALAVADLPQEKAEQGVVAPTLHDRTQPDRLA